MRKSLPYIICLCLLSLLIGYVFADATSWDIKRKPNESWLSGSVGDPAWNWMKEVDKLVSIGANPGTGKVFYVDSAVTTEGNGTSWENARNTIDEAVNLCEAGRGDIILVAQGHTETFITQALDCDVNDITIIGMGQGSNIPTIIYTHANGEVAIGADNVTIRNFRFDASVTDVLMAIEVEDGVDYFTLDGCMFTVNAAGTDEFAECVNFVNNNTGCVVKNCTFNMKAGGAVAAIMLDADTDQLTIQNNVIRGDYSTACINGDTTASTDLMIIGNILINGALVGDGGLNAQPVIELLDSTGGFVADNRIACDVATALLMRVADDMVFQNNYVSDDDGDEFSGVTEDSAASVTAMSDG